MDEIAAMLQEKISCHSRPMAHYEYQSVFRIFSRAPKVNDGDRTHRAALDKRTFGQILKRYFGLVLTPNQTSALFLRYDPTGRGRLHVLERFHP